MKILSLNRSLVKTTPYRGKEIKTGIFKEPTETSCLIRRSGLDGDVQVDRRYHGGTLKAIYSYSQEHYLIMQEYLKSPVHPGLFGENLTTEGLFEKDVFLGSQYRFGSAILEAIQPRMPCFKLGLATKSTSFITAFREAGMSGIYWKVVEEGEVKAGDSIDLVSISQQIATIHDVWRLTSTTEFDAELAKQILANHRLDSEWRETIQERYETIKSTD
jgi:MOSC domain-containing protein YiiM